MNFIRETSFFALIEAVFKVDSEGLISERGVETLNNPEKLKGLNNKIRNRRYEQGLHYR